MKMKKHWFHILLALAQGPSHGAEIRRRVLKNTNQELELYPAMLYGSLDDLLERQLIREVGEEECRPEGASARSRYLDLTQLGREVLSTEALEYRRVADVAEAFLAGGEVP